MRVLLYSDSGAVQKIFLILAKSGRISCETRPRSHLTRGKKDLCGVDIVYFDAAGKSENEIRKIAGLLAGKGARYGFIDPKRGVKDIARLFHWGASDYLGGEALEKGISVERMRQAVAYSPGAGGKPGSHSGRAKTDKSETSPGTDKAGPKKRVLAGSKAARRNRALPDRGTAERRGSSLGKSVSFPATWEKIVEGKEFAFCFMYVELDNVSEFRKTLGDKNIELLVNAFKDFVERSVSRASGRVWIWSEFYGLVLFPFNGRQCGAVLPCMRMILTRRVFGAGLPFLHTHMSFRIALHIGSTVYRRKGNTGTIVSDAVNSVFHLGRKHLKQGHFYMTDIVFDHTPESLKQCFRPAGKFEGFSIVRMLRPL